MTPGPDRWLVRKATPADAHAIATINIRSWQDAYRGLLPDSYLDDLSVSERTPRWRDRLAQMPHTQRAWIVEGGGEPVAYCISGPYRGARSERGPIATRSGEIYAIYCLPEHWGTGAGWAAFSAGVEGLKGQRFPFATLWMLEGNARGTRFYERAGWRLDGGRKTEPVNDAGTVSAPEVRWRFDWE